MEIVTECIDCILKRTEGIVNRSQFDQDTKKKIFLEVRNAITGARDHKSWVGRKVSPAQLGTIRQNILELYTLNNTYQVQKNMGLSIGKKAFALFENEDLTLAQAIIFSAVGNAIEFDIQGVNSTEEEIYSSTIGQLDTYFQDKRIYDQANMVTRQLETLSGKVIFLLDNVGEHYFDAILAHQLINLGWEVSFVVKGKPILNDVTRDDMLDYPVSGKIFDTDNDDIGLFLSRIDDNLLTIIQQADLLIIKGMAHFETLSRDFLHPPSLFLLKAKCAPIALAIGAKQGDIVLHFQKMNSSWISDH
ncbi:MAG: ARMT1-like domain-containing protein [Candidatus Kariarchaeaceae archaeon]|jgi:uncharacterized protein with ATP-grasp and redox domains